MVQVFQSFCRTYGGRVNNEIIRLFEQVICYVVQCIISCSIVTISFYCFICTLDTMVRSHYSYLLFNYTHPHVWRKIPLDAKWGQLAAVLVLGSSCIPVCFIANNYNFIWQCIFLFEHEIMQSLFITQAILIVHAEFCRIHWSVIMQE
jgi:hypothetical protein